MKPLRRKGWLLLLGVALLSGGVCRAEGQRMRPPRVYRPSSYNNTRTLMNRRAAAQKALKKHQGVKARRAGTPRQKAGRAPGPRARNSP